MPGGITAGGVDFGAAEAAMRRIRERMEQAKSTGALSMRIPRAGKVLELASEASADRKNELAQPAMGRRAIEPAVP